MDNILAFKSKSPYDYIQDSCFLRQMVGQKVFLFIMSLYGLANGVDLVRHMQPGGDLQNCWLMFDHVKCVKKWTTMACHVYDLMYCKVFTNNFVTCNLNQQSRSSMCHVDKTKPGDVQA